MTRDKVDLLNRVVTNDSSYGCCRYAFQEDVDRFEEMAANHAKADRNSEAGRKIWYVLKDT